MTKTPSTPDRAGTGDKTPDSLPIISFILGLCSLFGPGFLLGIPAILTGAIALKNRQNTQGLSIAGIITGSVSTAISVLFVSLVVWVIVWGLDTPYYFLEQQPLPVEERVFEGSAT